jgi:hypothetical protein
VKEEGVGVLGDILDGVLGLGVWAEELLPHGRSLSGVSYLWSAVLSIRVPVARL